MEKVIIYTKKDRWRRKIIERKRERGDGDIRR